MPRAPIEVFTPRRHEINPLTYVKRARHEADLERLLRGNLHVALPGISGSGKSWLYKGLFASLGISFDTLNLANARRHESIEAVIRSKLGEHSVLIDQSTADLTEGGASWIIGFKKSRTETKHQYPVDAVAAYFKFLHSRAGGRKSILVLENFETISDKKELLRQLSELIVLLDDAYYGQFNIQILVVGASSNILQMIESAASVPTVSNRLQTMPEIGALEEDEAEKIITNGFKELELPFLAYRVPQGICWYADCIAQHVQQISYEVAEASTKGKAVTSKSFEDGVRAWLLSHLLSDSDDINEHLMSYSSNKDTHQVLHALGRSRERNNTHVSVARTLTEIDPSNGSPKLSPQKIGRILSALSKGTRPLLRCPEGRNYFCFVKPTYRMVLRSTTLMDSEGNVRVLDPRSKNDFTLPHIGVVPKEGKRQENLSKFLLDEALKKNSSL